MISVERLVVGVLQTNCYILSDGKFSVVIDPGAEPERILGRIKSLKSEVKAILLTHGHFDHIGGVNEIKNATGAEVIAHEKEVEVINNPDLSNPFSVSTSEEKLILDRLVKGGDVLEFGNIKIEVLETPGHTYGSVCYLVNDFLFTGDTLFKGSVGRTDIGGDYGLMQSSLLKISKLPARLKIFPGHDDETTLEEELKSNPYLLNLEKVDEI